jgi:ABC-type phosphate transport system substrate-binding protein
MAAAIAVAFATLTGCASGNNSSTASGSTPGSYTISLTSNSGTITATPLAILSLTLN